MKLIKTLFTEEVFFMGRKPKVSKDKKVEICKAYDSGEDSSGRLRKFTM